MIERDDWRGLYREGWSKNIVPEAFSHPAKFRPAVVRRIYAYLLERGYIQPGAMILDPFGGVALGALEAMRLGMYWVGVELEARFVNLGQQNIDLWNRKYGTMPGWGQATILQGDSRHLCEVLAGAGFAGAVSSPPYITGGHHNGVFTTWGGDPTRQGGCAQWATREGGYGDASGNLGNLPEGDAPRVPQAGAVVSSMPFSPTRSQMIGQHQGTRDYYRKKNTVPEALFSRGNLGNLPAGESPCAAVVSSMPFTNSLASDDPDRRGGLFRDPKRRGDRNMTGEYGASEGQIGAMREGEPPSAVISSMPYIDSVNQSVQANDARAGIDRKAQAGVDVSRAVNVGGPNSVLNQPQVYGATPGQLGAMTEGQPVQVQASVSSSPWEASLDRCVVDKDARRQFAREQGISNAEFVSPIDTERIGKRNQEYGRTAGQLGTRSGATFWEASAEIMRQVYQVLVPGGYTAWVCKAFVRKGALVDFPGQWQALGESCGFETIAIIRAWLVEDQGAQFTLDNGLDIRKVERKAFFRRLQEFKARAAEFWKSLERDDKAYYLWQAHYALWVHYSARMLEDITDGEPPRPTCARITAVAQASAYRDAGEPGIETATQIDHEVILIQRKA